MPLDLLSAVEFVERAVETAESALRRRARALCVAGVVLLGGVAWVWGPSLWRLVIASSPHLSVERMPMKGARGKEDRNGGLRRAAGRAPLARSSARASESPLPLEGNGDEGRGPSRRAPHRGRSVSPTPPASGGEGPSESADNGATVAPETSARDADGEGAAPSRHRVEGVAPQKGTASPAVAESPYIWVYVTGAVKRPGVVRMARGGRAFEAVAAVGGVLPGADLTRVNLAVRLRDEAMLLIPRQAERSASPPRDQDATGPDGGGTPDSGDDEAPTGVTAPALPAEGGSAPGTSEPSSADEGARASTKASLAWLEAHPVHLNTATEEQLRALPAVGPAMAHAIVAWRARHGAFARVQDVRRVPRFGPRLWTRVARYLAL